MSKTKEPELVIKLLHTYKHTYIEFTDDDGYGGRKQKVKAFFKGKYGPKYDESRGKLTVKNATVFLRFDRVSEPNSYYRSCSRIKVMVARSEYDFGTADKDKYLRISEKKKTKGRLNVSKLIESIEKFAETKAEMEKQAAIQKKKDEFALMALAGKVSADIGFNVEIDEGELRIKGSKDAIKKDSRKQLSIKITPRDLKEGTRYETYIRLPARYSGLELSLDKFQLKEIITGFINAGVFKYEE